MFDLKFERVEKFIKQLYTKRIVGTQVRRKEDNQIISRTFQVYTFEEDLKIKVVNEPPPFWTGVIPSDTSTYTNPIQESFDYHYIVKTPFTINEYSGYLMYGQPIENLDELNLPENFINPNDLNLYKGWFKRLIKFSSYDYFIPMRTGDEFRWEVERIQINVTPDPTEDFNGFIQDEFEEKVNNIRQEYIDKGYTILSSNINNSGNSKIDNSTDNLDASLIAVKNIFNTGGVDLLYVDVNNNRAAFVIKPDNTAVAIRFYIKNCIVWLSNDVNDSQSYNLLFNDHKSTSITEELVTIEKIREYKYLIIQPTLTFIDNRSNLTSTDPYLPMMFTPKINEGFQFIAEFLGRHYLHFKEDIVDVEQQTLIKNSSSYTVDLNDPKPEGIDLSEYVFTDEESSDYWDATLKF